LARLNLGDMGGEGLGFLLLPARMGLGMALGELRRIHGDKPHRGQGDVALSIFDLHLAGHTAAVPPPWRIRATLAGFLKQHG
jgi:hypothetical protein